MTEAAKIPLKEPLTLEDHSFNWAEAAIGYLNPGRIQENINVNAIAQEDKKFGKDHPNHDLNFLLYAFDKELAKKSAGQEENQFSMQDQSDKKYLATQKIDYGDQTATLTVAPKNDLANPVHKLEYETQNLRIEFAFNGENVFEYSSKGQEKGPYGPAKIWARRT